MLQEIIYTLLAAHSIIAAPVADLTLDERACARLGGPDGCGPLSLSTTAIPEVEKRECVVFGADDSCDPVVDPITRPSPIAMDRRECQGDGCGLPITLPLETAAARAMPLEVVGSESLPGESASLTAQLHQRMCEMEPGLTGCGGVLGTPIPVVADKRECQGDGCDLPITLPLETAVPTTENRMCLALDADDDSCGPIVEPVEPIATPLAIDRRECQGDGCNLPLDTAVAEYIKVRDMPIEIPDFDSPPHGQNPGFTGPKKQRAIHMVTLVADALGMRALPTRAPRGGVARPVAVAAATAVPRSDKAKAVVKIAGAAVGPSMTTSFVKAATATATAAVAGTGIKEGFIPEVRRVVQTQVPKFA